MKSLHKLIGVLLALLVLGTMFLQCEALGVAVVSADPVTTAAGETVMIPVKIVNNTGIMGFRISVNYSETIFKLPAVTAGEMLRNGMMTDSIAVKENGSFDILWSNSENVSGNGTLFNLSFQVADNTQPGSYTITLTYNKEDTFDQSWSGVTLIMHPIRIIVKTNDAVKSRTESETHSENDLQSEITRVQAEIENRKEAITNVTNDWTFPSVSLSESSGSAEERVRSVLGSDGANLLQAIPEERREEIIQQIVERIESGAASNPESVLNELKQHLEQVEVQGQEEEKSNVSLFVIIIAAAGLIFVAVAAILIYVFKRKKSNSKEAVS